MVSIEQETENVLLQMYKKKITFMIDGQNFFDQPDKSDKRTRDNIRKIATGQGDDYTTGCLLDYPNISKIIIRW